MSLVGHKQHARANQCQQMTKLLAISIGALRKSAWRWCPQFRRERGETPDLDKLTFHLDHSAGADQPSHLISPSLPKPFSNWRSVLSLIPVAAAVSLTVISC
jgi:hypothetical protein